MPSPGKARWAHGRKGPAIGRRNGTAAAATDAYATAVYAAATNVSTAAGDIIFICLTSYVASPWKMMVHQAACLRRPKMLPLLIVKAGVRLLGAEMSRHYLRATCRRMRASVGARLPDQYHGAVRCPQAWRTCRLPCPRSGATVQACPHLHLLRRVGLEMMGISAALRAACCNRQGCWITLCLRLQAPMQDCKQKWPSSDQSNPCIANSSAICEDLRSRKAAVLHASA